MNTPQNMPDPYSFGYTEEDYYAWLDEQERENDYLEWLHEQDREREFEAEKQYLIQFDDNGEPS